MALVMVVVAVTGVLSLGVALALDGASNGYAAVTHRDPPGMRMTRKVRYWLWRIAFQRILGPPPIEVRTLREMLALSPSEFEFATATVFRGLGYRHVRVVGKAGDYCVDINAVDPSGRSTVIQCKRYGPGNTVGSPEVQTFLGMTTVHHRAERGIFVTTSKFTANARTIERQSGGVLELIDGERLGHLIARAPSPVCDPRP
jgi:hypothetical protein